MPDPADVPVVVLCGGLGTRLREASERLPKPLVDVGGRPVLWHILKGYGAHGFRRFVLPLGYKGELIKRWFLDYRALSSDFTLRMGDGHSLEFHAGNGAEDWEVTFVETGLRTGTGSRLRRVERYLADAPTFCVTYGDGLSDVDLTALLSGHLASGALATVTGVHPGSRYGELTADPEGDRVRGFAEKPVTQDGWVSGGFFVLQREVLDLLDPARDDQYLERGPLQELAARGELRVHRHEGFWLGMDTYRDWTEVTALWESGQAPWKTWEASP